MSLASGPALELFDILRRSTGEKVFATCVDIDPEALKACAGRARALGCTGSISLARENIFYLIDGRKRSTFSPQHLIYSTGFVDYLKDKHVVALLNWAYDHLVPGGEAIFGNYSLNNPHKAMMDHILEWRLIHRDNDHLLRLFAESKFGAAPVEFLPEESGVFMFARVRRPALGSRSALTRRSSASSSARIRRASAKARIVPFFETARAGIR